MLLFVLVLSLVAQACSSSPTTQQPNQKTDQHLKSIFILAGQSNMAGRGGVVNDTTTGIVTWDGVVPSECSPSSSVFRLNANLTWVKAREPLHADIDVEKTNGIGPCMAFANAVLANHSSTVGRIGLVPCAIGGTNITQWRRGSFLYNQMIGRAKASLQNGGSIRALLWYQGESDTASTEDARSYKNRLETFLGDVRLDLESPNLPIIQVALASGYEATLTEIVREGQLGVDFLNVRTVDAKGLPLEPDGLHLTTPAQVQLGKMLADAYLQFLPGAINKQFVIGSHRIARYTLHPATSKDGDHRIPFAGYELKGVDEVQQQQLEFQDTVPFEDAFVPDSLLMQETQLVDFSDFFEETMNGVHEHEEEVIDSDDDEVNKLKWKMFKLKLKCEI